MPPVHEHRFAGDKLHEIKEVHICFADYEGGLEGLPIYILRHCRFPSENCSMKRAAET